MRITAKILLLLLPLPSLAIAAAPLPEDYAPPAISMQQGIALAKQCLAAKNIDIQSLYLQSPTFLPSRELNRTGADKGRHWLVAWQRPGVTFGGQVTAMVYEDQTCGTVGK